MGSIIDSRGGSKKSLGLVRGSLAPGGNHKDFKRRMNMNKEKMMELTVQDILTILRGHGDNPEEMEQVLRDLSKEEQVKLKNFRVTLIDQLDCPQSARF